LGPPLRRLPFRRFSNHFASYLEASVSLCLLERCDETLAVKLTLFQIKLAHTVIFWILSLCTIYALYSGLADRITPWTWIAVGLPLVESIALAASGWTCPLTILAERQGALQGSVADIFLPKWLADRIFPICGTMYALALVLIVWRLLG